MMHCQTNIKSTELNLFTSLAPTNAQIFILCILLLICPYVFRCSRHPQGAYTNIIETYSNKIVLLHKHSTGRTVLPFGLTQPKEQPRHLQQPARFYLLPFPRKKIRRP